MIHCSESQLYWCEECKIPLYEPVCGCCGAKGRQFVKDVRVVFPEEKVLLEILLGLKAGELNEKSLWNAAGNVYYLDGVRMPLSIQRLREMDAGKIRKTYDENRKNMDDTFFKQMTERFVKANANRYQEISQEALSYIWEETQGMEIGDMFVSFSGGKDSTVTADLVTRALSNPQIMHIFGDTTLEFPYTYEYVQRFRKDHPKTPLISARNKEKDFEELCKLVGPPSRVMRWCCTIFKTGTIQKRIKSLYRDKNQILTFYGIRRSESLSRSKYERESDSPKITKQRIVSPIIDWMDFDIWLYILTSGIDFNDAYRLGYARVGCWCCPNNSGWSEFLSKIHMHEQSERFRTLLIDFARSIGKEDAEVYVDDGFWKARQGGNGV